MSTTMVDVHQSYDDFQLDALIQYDLADDEDDLRLKDDCDVASIDSGIMDDAAFDSLYESTPCMVYDEEETTRPSLREVKKLLLAPHRKKMGHSIRTLRHFGDGSNVAHPVRRHSLGELQVNETNNSCKRKKYGLSGTFRTISRLLKRKSNRTYEKLVQRGGVERTKSSRTEGTTLYDDMSMAGEIQESTSIANKDSSTSSICYLDDEDCNEVLADKCYKILNDSISTISDGNGATDDTLSSWDKILNLPKFNRSMPIIETNNLQSLTLVQFDRPKPLRRRSLSHFPYMQSDF
jgi:hypothetical protein